MSNGTLIAPNNGMVLAEAKHPSAKLAMDRIEVIRSRLPAHINPMNFMSAVIAEINGLPNDVTQPSVAETTMNCAIMGLIPGKALGHAHFVPFNITRKDRSKIRVCQLVVGYQGFLDLAFGNNFLRSAYANVVVRGEEFDYRVTETGPKLVHVPNLDRVESKDNIVASYCVYETHNGGHGTVVVTRKQLDDVDKHRDAWEDDYPAMARKTSILRAAKLWKKTPSLALAVQLQEQHARGEQQSCDENMAPDQRLVKTADFTPKEPGDEA